ncbi:MAG: DUF2075 domain-containing protein [Acidobacteria bacterium]|nr:DUF2075 domain-containing protein [Acidobacteriota bacterium]
MTRAYYSAPVPRFLDENQETILGILLSRVGNQNLRINARNAWQAQIPFLKTALRSLDKGFLYFEFAIPRMGKRADNVLIIGDSVYVIEFKVGAAAYTPYIEQVVDYALDLKNFHEGSHSIKIFPILVCTNAPDQLNQLDAYPDKVFKPLLANASNLESVFHLPLSLESSEPIKPSEWENSPYRPTPTIIEAAQALYNKNSVDAITRHSAGAKNLSETSSCVESAISYSRTSQSKVICFVTGVPGAGKTLAGLNIATKYLETGHDRSVFLSGNGPLVDVLRESLARDKVSRAQIEGIRVTLSDARRETTSFVQNIHHWRDYYIAHPNEVPDGVVVFDEAQRAWTKDKLTDFMSRKRGTPNFNKSEPEFLIDVMNRRSHDAAIVCLIGGGQEIGSGEAGLGEWIKALRDFHSDWRIYVSDQIVSQDIYVASHELRGWLLENACINSDLHLSVPVRSFRSENLANFVEAVLSRNTEEASQLLYTLEKDGYPIRLTRSLPTAKNWLRDRSRGTEPAGLVASAGAHRLRPHGISVRENIDAPTWFLNPRTDIRSCNFLEEVATEFSIQGLELDWTCVCWDGDMFIKDGEWELRRFRGTRWEQVNDEFNRRYLGNAYRVLLTRARQGMVIFLPCGDTDDHTRLPEFYDGTFEYLKSIGLKLI